MFSSVGCRSDLSLLPWVIRLYLGSNRVPGIWPHKRLSWLFRWSQKSTGKRIAPNISPLIRNLSKFYLFIFFSLFFFSSGSSSCPPSPFFLQHLVMKVDKRIAYTQAQDLLLLEYFQTFLYFYIVEADGHFVAFLLLLGLFPILIPIE